MKRALVPTAIAFLLLAAWPARAQYAQSGWTEYHPQQTKFTLGYQMSQGIGDLHTYASSASFRGFTFDWRSLLSKQFSAGVRFAWNRYNDTLPNESVTTSTGGILSGPVYHYMDQFAIQAIGHYYFNAGDSPLLPFLGVGIGGVWSSSYQQTADLSLSQNGFYFIVSPEIGLNFTLARGSTSAALNLAVLYNFSTISFRNVSNAQGIAETVGLTFSY